VINRKSKKENTLLLLLLFPKDNIQSAAIEYGGFDELG
jgi:hypothetical protein